jgi:outer membrane biosynthesis protein TonB
MMMLKLQKMYAAASVLMIAATSVYSFPVNAVPKPTTSPKPVPKPANSAKPVPKPTNSGKPVPKPINSPKPSPTPPPPIKANPVFQSVVPQIRKVTQIPVLLPKEIPIPQGGSQLYATVDMVTPQKYIVLLEEVPNCNRVIACRYGAVVGEAVTSKTPRLIGKAIFLRKGVTAYFTASICAANCSDAVIMWRQKGIQYSVGVRAFPQDALMKIANSLVVP